MKVVFYTFAIPRQTTYKVGKLLEKKGFSVLFLNPRFQIEGLPHFPSETRFFGLGDYMKTAKRLRLETEARNRYGISSIISDGTESYQLQANFIFDEAVMYKASSVSNGPCNRSAYLLSSKFGEGTVAFLHVPRWMKPEIVAEQVKHLTRQWKN